MMVRRPTWFWMAWVCLGASGCTALREIPRTEYASRPERRNVRLVTQDDLAYEFDYVTVSVDSLTGYRRRNVEGPFEDYATWSLALEDIKTLSARGVNWTRTGLIGGGVLAALVAKGLSDSKSGPVDTGGGGPPTRPPTP